jgi:cytochrome P450
MLNSANRDEAIFADPDTIDLSRSNVKEHLAFGYGIHFCVGAPLARLELNIALEELVKRLPSLEIVSNQNYLYLPNISFRGPLKMYVKW